MAISNPYDAEALNPYYDPYRSAGEEISSTYEGRHVRIIEGNLVHVDIDGDGLVNKGQPVSFGLGWEGLAVGIALRSAGSDYEAVEIDTEGIWRCEVVAAGDMTVGQLVFITDAGVLVDWPLGPNDHIFGYTLQPMSTGTATIAVKVHWMDTGVWWWWFWFFWSQYL